METLVCDIARNRMERDFNSVLCDFGLFTKSIRFEENNGLRIVVEISANEGMLTFEYNPDA